MKAFLDSPELAVKIRAQVQAHFDADEIIHGKYWENGKGCAVGCLVHSANHAEFETKLGIPKEIAYLVDGLFEALPNGIAKEFPLRIVNAIKPGADLSMVIPQFLLWMLSDPKIGSITDVRYDETKRFVKAVIAIFEEWVKTGTKPASDSELARAARAAWDAGDAWAARDAWAAWGDARAAWAAWDARNKAAADKLIELLEAA